MDLYYMPLSSPCRAVLLTASTIGINLNLKYLDLFSGKHLEPDFLKFNPKHCIPTLVDNGFPVWESRAIMTYLADKYEKETLYPKDLEKRTIVNQRLYFDAFFYQKFVDYYIPQVYLKKPEDAEKIAPIKLNMQFLNTFLEGQEWVCGENMTLADLALIATVSTLVESAGMDIGGYPNVVKWYKKCQETIPGYEANTAGCEDYKKLFKGLPKIS